MIAGAMSGDSNPFDMALRLSAGAAALRRGRAADALREAQKAAIANPSASDPLALLHHTMSRHGTRGAALRSLSWARTINPRDRALLGRLLDASGSLRRDRISARACDDIERYHGLDADLLAAAAERLFGLKQETRAAGLARRALMADPSTGQAAFLTLWRFAMNRAMVQRAERITRWWIIAIGDDQSFRASCDTAARLGDPNRLIGAVCQALDRGINPLAWQQRISQLSAQLTAVSRTQGTRVAARASRRVVSKPRFQSLFRDASTVRPETDALIRLMADSSIDENLRDGLRALAAARPDAAARAYGRFAETGAPLPPAFEALVTDGPDIGHPLWHVANPYYRVWVEAASDSDAQAGWQTNQVFTGADDTDAEQRYTDWLASDVPARHLLRLLIDRMDARSIRVLDVGCGFGQWLRFLADRCGVRVENLLGLDLHESRVAATRRVLRNAVDRGADCAGDPVSVIADNVRRHDLLDPGANRDWDLTRIDLITLFVVTGCFDDAQLDQLIRRLASIGPRYLFVTTVTRRWQLWNGRANEEAFFARHGFRETERHWTPEPLTLDPLSALVIPRRYWTNLGVRIYQLDGPSRSKII